MEFVVSLRPLLSNCIMQPECIIKQLREIELGKSDFVRR